MRILLTALLATTLLSACTTMSGSTSEPAPARQGRTIGAVVDDTTIHSRLTFLLMGSDSKEAYRGVNIEVSEGRVLLTGQVKNPENSVFAVKNAWSINGVREVMNEIQVAEKASLLDSTKDIWITSKIKSKMLLEKGVASTNYSFETINRNVYIIGIAQSNEELNKVLYLVSNTDGVARTVNYVRLPNGQPAAPQTYNANSADTLQAVPVQGIESSDLPPPPQPAY